MATMRGNAGGYGMGAPSYGGGSMSEPAQEGGALDAIRQHTSKIEDMLDSLAEPVKPYAILSAPDEDGPLASSSDKAGLLTV